MTQQPGYYGSPPPNVPPTPPGQAGAAPRQRTKPRLRKVKLTIEDTAGNTWTTAGKLVTDPKERSGAAKALGWIAALVLIGGAALVSAWILGWVVSLVHAWWPFVPELPYSVALKITLVLLLGGFIGAFIKIFVFYALGIRRLPESDE